MKPKHHFLVCMNQRPPGHPRGSCSALGAGSVFEAFRAEVERRELFGTVQVTGTFCMGPCDQGPTVVVYPEGVWYGHVTAADVEELLDTHIQQRGAVERLQIA
ncbi:MAG: (2Fe-2S) ferredoxin domain-containing protein [Magnetococcales bacterium]|nr:(2Fe-2S) ferredoxin domain-containing protein [Magnetococcales bacterium]